jgi:hypothetical protein
MRELSLSTHTAMARLAVERTRSTSTGARAPVNEVQWPLSAQQAHWLLQANRQLSDDMLRSAAKAGASDPDVWSARILALARQGAPGAGPPPTLLARMVASLNPANPPTVAETRQLAKDYAATAASRSDEQAWDAFNRPAHWVRGSDGMLAPDPARLRGVSLSAWNALETKFGPLARAMFDANVRGGMMRILAILDAARSPQPLTVRDLAGLQRIAQTDGMDNPLATPLRELLTHDVMHVFGRYGVAETQELPGDRFAEAMLRSLFKVPTEEDLANAEVFKEPPKIQIDLGQPLDRQPAAVRDIQALIASKFEGVSSQLLRPAVEKAFYTRRPVEIFMADLNHRWTGKSPVQAARQAEQVLDANGLLAHLDPAARERVLFKVYGRPGSNTLEGVVSRNDPSGPDFKRAFTDWVNFTLAPAVVGEAPDRLISREDFTNRAIDVIAAGLLFERTAPGALAKPPVDTTLTELEQAPGIAELNLRTAYPPVREEVRRNLLRLAP